jgi:hypothetical protein
LTFGQHIIFLDENGHITRQGNRDTLSAGGRDFQRFASQPPTRTSQLEPELPEDALRELEMLEYSTPGDSRYAGDVRIYAYYANIAGWWTISVYLFACAVFVFGVTFPCKLFDAPQA